FDLPESTLPRNFHLVKHAPDGHVVTLPDELHAEVHGGGRVLPLAAKGSRVDAPFRGFAHAIDGDDRVVAQLTPSLTLIARYVRAERQKDTPALQRIDVPFAVIVLLALLALFAFFRVMSSVPRVDLDRDALAQNPERFAKYQVKPVEKAPEPPKA